MTRRIGITLGEPEGIGPEIVLRTLWEGLPDDVLVTMYGSPRLAERTAQRFGIDPFWEVTGEVGRARLELIPCGPDPVEGRFSSPSERADAVLTSLERASGDALKGILSALVTAPIDKSIVRTRIPEFTGHTGHLAELAHCPRTLMLLDNTEIRVVLLTEHIALREVPSAVTQESIVEAALLVARAFSEWFQVRTPRMALAGLNPHAGEIVSLPEEKSVMEPAVAILRERGIDIEGPLPADSLYPAARSGKWDVVLSPYHDQGLVAAKYSGLDKVVNITLGLPYLRLSPGHGVAYDISGKKPADPRSFARALRIAITRELTP